MRYPLVQELRSSELYIIGTTLTSYNFNLYKSFGVNDKMDIDIKKIERVLTESFGFLFLFGIIKVIEYLHLNGILPVYFHLM